MIGAERAVRLGANRKAEYRYYRLHITSRTGSTNNTRVAELNIITEENWNGVPTEGTASANSTSTGGGGTRNPSSAFDGNSSTSWWSATNPTSVNPIWLQWEFPQPQSAIGYRVQAGEFDDLNRGAPRTFSFQGSEDGIAWDVLDDQPQPQLFESGQVREYLL